MQDRKLTVVRFTNEQIFNDLETVLIAIAEQISSPLPIQPSSPALLPRGEGSQKEGNQKEQEGNPLISQNTPTHVPLLPREKGLEDEGKSQNADEIILERLVKLNADRAAEERNGLIRWLRPEYQAPDTIVHAPALPGLLTEEPTIVLPTEQKTWSKNPKDQLTALQDLFRTHPTEWTLIQIAAQFKNGTRNQKSIRDNLDRLEFFGILLHYQTDGLDRWSIALQ